MVLRFISGDNLVITIKLSDFTCIIFICSSCLNRRSHSLSCCSCRSCQPRWRRSSRLRSLGTFGLPRGSTGIDYCLALPNGLCIPYGSNVFGYIEALSRDPCQQKVSNIFCSGHPECIIVGQRLFGSLFSSRRCHGVDAKAYRRPCFADYEYWSRSKCMVLCRGVGSKIGWRGNQWSK